VGKSHAVFVSRSCRSDVSEREYKLAEIPPLEDLQTSHGHSCNVERVFVPAVQVLGSRF
jgi:hypothetical protein